MPRQEQRKQFLNFVAGLNTESSPLVFPPNTAKSLDNIDLLRDGSIKRRRGLDFEAGGAYSTTKFTDAVLSPLAISAHEWDSVDGDDTQNFLVIQVGGTLYFHTKGADVFSTSVIGSIDLDPIKTNLNFANEAIDTAFAKGKLFVVGRGISPAYIEYDADGNFFRGVKITLKIRDIDGIEEDTESPLLFGGPDIQPPEETTDPEDDIDDILTPPVPPFDPDDFFDFFPIPSPTPGF